MGMSDFHCWHCGESTLGLPVVDSCFFWCDDACKDGYEARIAADKKKYDDEYKAWNKAWDAEVTERDKRIADRLAGNPWPDEIIGSAAQKKAASARKRQADRKAAEEKKKKKPSTALVKTTTTKTRPSARRTGSKRKRTRKQKEKMSERIRQMAPIDVAAGPTRQNKCSHCHKKGHNVRKCKEL